MAKEIEVKVQIERSATLRQTLERDGAFLYQEQQIDEYFTPPDRNFLDQEPVVEWLRLRQAGGAWSINYKYWRYNDKGESNYCDEYESELTDGPAVKSVLTALGFRSLVTVDKTRKVWKFRDYEVALDHVEGLGDFIEMEYKGKGNDADAITEGMISFLKTMECGTIERNFRGYPYLLLEKSEQLKK